MSKLMYSEKLFMFTLRGYRFINDNAIKTTYTYSLFYSVVACSIVLLQFFTSKPRYYVMFIFGMVIVVAFISICFTTLPKKSLLSSKQIRKVCYATYQVCGVTNLNNFDLIRTWLFVV